MRKAISITIDEQMLEKVDKKRGLISRSRFIEEVLKKVGGQSGIIH